MPLMTKLLHGLLGLLAFKIFKQYELGCFEPLHDWFWDECPKLSLEHINFEVDDLSYGWANYYMSC